MKAKASGWKASGMSIGFVPTMGYLHEGHMSLIREAARENDVVVVSVFVNPIQFGANEDFGRYPQDMARDSDLCARAGVDAVFNPSASDMYPTDFCGYVDMSVVTEGLCGAKRPGHFRGVATVVMKFFHIINPDRAYFGQKDAQQLAVIRRMTRDFNMDVAIIGLPIVRDHDGLAMSSRNAYLAVHERAASLSLHKALQEALKLYRRGENSAKRIKRLAEEILSNNPLIKTDYIEIVDAETMRPLKDIDRPALCAVAAFVGETRLIDNILFNVREEGL
jgi:pantoate--beta-alanine ligase